MTDEKTVNEDETTEEVKKTEVETKQPEKKEPIDFVIERKQKKREELKKLQAEIDEYDKITKSPSDDINATIDRKIAQKMSTNTSVNEFIRKYNLEEHREKIEKYAHDPSRQNLPVETRIIEAVGLETFIKLGATAREQAELEAKESRMGGGSPMSEKEKTEVQKQKEVADEFFKNSPFMKTILKS